MNWIVKPRISAFCQDEHYVFQYGELFFKISGTFQ